MADSDTQYSATQHSDTDSEITQEQKDTYLIKDIKCSSCKKITGNDEALVGYTTDGRKNIKAKCIDCGKKKHSFIPEDEKDKEHKKKIREERKQKQIELSGELTLSQESEKPKKERKKKVPKEVINVADTDDDDIETLILKYKLKQKQYGYR